MVLNRIVVVVAAVVIVADASVAVAAVVVVFVVFYCYCDGPGSCCGCDGCHDPTMHGCYWFNNRDHVVLLCLSDYRYCYSNSSSSCSMKGSSSRRTRIC